MNPYSYLSNFLAPVLQADNDPKNYQPQFSLMEADYLEPSMEFKVKKNDLTFLGFFFFFLLLCVEIVRSCLQRIKLAYSSLDLSLFSFFLFFLFLLHFFSHFFSQFFSLFPFLSLFLLLFFSQFFSLSSSCRILTVGKA